MMFDRPVASLLVTLPVMWTQRERHIGVMSAKRTVTVLAEPGRR